MSRRLELLRLVLRRLARPRMARVATPAEARRHFRQGSRLFVPPPFLLHQTAGAPWYGPNEASEVEKPPVDIVVSAWFTASKPPMPTPP